MSVKVVDAAHYGSLLSARRAVFHISVGDRHAGVGQGVAHDLLDGQPSLLRPGGYSRHGRQARRMLRLVGRSVSATWAGGWLGEGMRAIARASSAEGRVVADRGFNVVFIALRHYVVM